MRFAVSVLGTYDRLCQNCVIECLSKLSLGLRLLDHWRQESPVPPKLLTLTQHESRFSRIAGVRQSEFRLAPIVGELGVNIS